MSGRTKRIDPQCVASVSAAVRELIDRDFEGNQTAAAKALGVSQGHLSQVLRGGDRGPGLSFLISLRAYTGRSIDSLLGLEAEESDAERLARAVLAGRHRPRPATPTEPLAPLSPKGSSDAPRSRRR